MLSYCLHFFIFFYLTFFVLEARESFKGKVLKDSNFSLEEKKIKKITEIFIRSVLSNNIEKLKALTIEKQREFYEKLNRESKIFKKDRKTKKSPFHSYFANFKKYNIDFVYFDKELDRAIVYCRFEFNYYDKRNGNIVKIRKVHYYFKKHKGNWKIAFSKLKKEYLVYNKEKSNKWFR